MQEGMQGGFVKLSLEYVCILKRESLNDEKSSHHRTGTSALHPNGSWSPGKVGDRECSPSTSKGTLEPRRKMAPDILSGRWHACSRGQAPGGAAARLCADAPPRAPRVLGEAHPRPHSRVIRPPSGLVPPSLRGSLLATLPCKRICGRGRKWQFKEKTSLDATV